jgi:hypothetical protein
MTQNEPLLTAEAWAAHTLDVHYGMQLGCSPPDLRREGWTIVPARQECDPTALLFEQRPILSLVAPVQSQRAEARGGVATVTPELRGPLGELLRAFAPDALFTAEGLRALDELLARFAPDRLTRAEEARVRLACVTQASFRPYVGQWQEWIEPLDEAAETAPVALGLLARYGGGVYAVRQSATIVSYAGIRSLSPSVAEIGARTAPAGLRGHGLGRAVVSRATKAVLAADRVPLYRYAAGNAPAARISLALGYRLYADAISYYAPAGS